MFHRYVHIYWRKSVVYLGFSNKRNLFCYFCTLFLDEKDTKGYTKIHDLHCNLGFCNFILKLNFTTFHCLTSPPASCYLSRCNSLLRYNIDHHRIAVNTISNVCASPWLLCWHPCTESQCTNCTVGERDLNLMWLQEIDSLSVPHVTKFCSSVLRELIAPQTAWKAV